MFVQTTEKITVNFFMARSKQKENLLPLHVLGVSYQLFAVYVAEGAQWATPIVAVDHSQLRTIALTTGYPIY